MDGRVIDLRSDTVTRPSLAMRQAMAEAEVGDDVYIEDPTVNRLQARAAEIFAREAGLFVPSGSMGNLTCIMAQAERGQEVICEATGHIYNYDMASMAALAGVLPRVVAAEDGIMNWEQIAPAIREKAYTRPQTALVALENTHKMLGGGMRQVGVLAAPALIALEEGPKRLLVDHENAQLLAQGLAHILRIRIQPEKVQTNIIIYDVGDSGLNSSEFLQRLAEPKVL